MFELGKDARAGGERRSVVWFYLLLTATAVVPQEITWGAAGIQTDLKLPHHPQSQFRWLLPYDYYSTGLR